MKKTLLVFAGSLAVASVTFAAGPPIKEGLWEITTRMEMHGAPPGMHMPNTITLKHCYTKKDVEQDMTVPHDNKNCKVTNFKRSGNKATWAMQCTGRNPMTGSGEMTFAGDSYEGTINMHTQGRDMVQHVKGRRIGECK